MLGSWITLGWLTTGLSHGFSSSACSATDFTAGGGLAIVSYAPDDEEMSEVDEAAEGESEESGDGTGNPASEDEEGLGGGDAEMDDGEMELVSAWCEGGFGFSFARSGNGEVGGVM